MSARRGKASSARSLPRNLETTFPPGHSLRLFVERYADEFAPMDAYGATFLREALSQLDAEGTLPPSDDVHFEGAFMLVRALREGLLTKMAPNQAQQSMGEALVRIGKAMGYRPPLETFLKFKLDLSGNGPLDRLALALRELAPIVFSEMVGEERASQTSIDPKVLGDRLTMDGVLMASSRLSEPMPVSTFIRFFDIGGWEKSATHPLRLMIRHFSGLDTPPGTTAAERKEIAKVLSTLKQDGFLDLPGSPQFVPRPLPLSPEQQRDPLTGMDDLLDTLAEIDASLSERADRNGKVCLVSYEIPHTVSQDDLATMARYGVAKVLHQITADLTEDGITVADNAAVESVTWHLTERGLLAAKAATGALAVSARGPR